MSHSRKPKQSQPLPSLSKNVDPQQERMPSASAKIEKLASSDAADPVKQFTITLEKKVRNLEKRKQKLDNYRSDVENGKELNEDQKLAVSKYESVVELLEYSKELCKSLNAITQESTRIQKKLAKKEQIERQQHEIQRLQEAFCYKHILSCLDNEDVRNDLSNGENGAPKVSPEDLAHLDQFYKLIGPALPNDQGDIESHFHALAENLIFLVEGKNKDVVGTTYKALKELLHTMKESGYFTRSLDSGEDVSTADEMPEHEDPIVIDEAKKINVPEEVMENGDNYSQAIMPNEVAEATVAVVGETVSLESAVPEKTYQAVETTVPKEESYKNSQNGSLQEVLSPEGNFNFLQESQIELDSPHMDPAVVAVHQVTPASAMGFNQVAPQFQQVQNNNVEHVAAGSEESQPCSVQQQQPEQLPGPGIAPTVQRSVQPVLTSSIQHSDFDPNHPIPTQTYTNQSYAVMQHVIIPPYVPVTMHHAPLPPHIAPMPVSLSSPVSSQASNVVPVHVTMAAAVSPVLPSSEAVLDDASKCEIEGETVEEHAGMNGNMSGSEMAQNNGERNEDSEGFTVQNNYQRNFRGRGRGRSSGGGYYRGGRGGYNRGGYQNYYNGGNYRRGGPRGRSNSSVRGNRGGSFRPQQTQQQHQ